MSRSSLDRSKNCAIRNEAFPSVWRICDRWNAVRIQPTGRPLLTVQRQKDQKEDLLPDRIIESCTRRLELKKGHVGYSGVRKPTTAESARIESADKTHDLDNYKRRTHALRREKTEPVSRSVDVMASRMIPCPGRSPQSSPGDLALPCGLPANSRSFGRPHVKS